MRWMVAAVAAAALVGALAADGGCGRYAVGLAPDADRAAVRGLLDAPQVPSRTSCPSRRSSSTRPRRRRCGCAGVRYVERLGERSLSFTPTDPLVRAAVVPGAEPGVRRVASGARAGAVRVALIDSGVDADHPDLAGRIADARSFVGGAPSDTQGHGTIIAGIIAAQTGNDIGIAGLAPSAELLVAKVVTARRTIPVEAEAKAIRWAVEQGARVINMSLGGLRDPRNPSRDTYSRLEADAVAYATSKNVVVVAAVGNSDQAPRSPWPFASYPAALPHVLGVSALGRDGSSPRSRTATRSTTISRRRARTCSRSSRSP